MVPHMHGSQRHEIANGAFYVSLQNAALQLQHGEAVPFDQIILYVSRAYNPLLHCYKCLETGTYSHIYLTSLWHPSWNILDRLKARSP